MTIHVQQVCSPLVARPDIGEHYVCTIKKFLASLCAKTDFLSLSNCTHFIFRRVSWFRRRQFQLFFSENIFCGWTFLAFIQFNFFHLTKYHSNVTVRHSTSYISSLGDDCLWFGAGLSLTKLFILCG